MPEADQRSQLILREYERIAFGGEETQAPPLVIRTGTYDTHPALDSAGCFVL